MARGDVMEFPDGPRVFAPKLVGQGLTGGLGEECPNDVGVGDIGHRVALLGESPDVVTERLPLLLLAAPEVTRIAGTLIHVGRVLSIWWPGANSRNGAPKYKY